MGSRVFEAIWTGLLVALLCWLASVLWTNRARLRLLRLSWLWPFGEVRVSVASLLRLQDDDRYVLVHSPVRPDAFGPPGGVVKYHPAARAALDRIGFREERRMDSRMRSDLRGFVPRWALPRFARWLDQQDGRETSLECLRRELAEELREIGHSELASDIDRLQFVAVRHVLDGPLKAVGRPYRQLRFFDVWDLDPSTAEALRLRDALVALAADPAEDGAVCVTADEIMHGRSGRAYIAPQSAYLVGDRRFHADLPSLN